MKWVLLTAVALKTVCVSLDSRHDVFCPISMYQTAEFFHLGDWFVGLMAVGVALILRQIYQLPEALNVIREIVGAFVLLLILGFLWLLPLEYGHLHLLVAVSAMAGGTALLYRCSATWQDPLLKAASVGMVPLCLLPVFAPRLFGIAENILVFLLLAGFTWFQHVTLDRRETPATLLKPPQGLPESLRVR
jgi:hypothetical protein